MAHFAELNENNVVLRVIVFSNTEVNANGGDYSSEAETFVKARHGGHAWKQCSYNNNRRKQYPGKNYTYDSSKDIFIRPKPFDSWTLNDDSEWEAPVTQPTTEQKQYTEDGIVKEYIILWDNDNDRWIAWKYDNNPSSNADKYLDTGDNSWKEL